MMFCPVVDVTYRLNLFDTHTVSIDRPWPPHIVKADEITGAIPRCDDLTMWHQPGAGNNAT